jgi:hypothetical protein
MNSQYFISLHQILLPEKNFYVEKITQDEIIIDYQYAKLNYKFKNDKIIISDITTNIDSQHILRLLEAKKIFSVSDQVKPTYSIVLDEESCVEYLMCMNNILFPDCKNFCTGCGSELNIKGLKKISHCENVDCKNKYYSLVTDNSVMDLYNQDPRVFMFLLNVFVSGLTHPKVTQTFKPFPFVSDISNIDELKKIIPNELEPNNHIKLMDKFNGSSDDLELFTKLNPYSYCIIKNAISNNYFSMSSRENVLSDSSIIFIHINYSAEIENKFQQNYYLFHGSSIYSWYPIIKNGLKVMSGTTLQANGAAYGQGIYFSDSFQFSLGYSSNRSSSNTNVVGVFEILEDPAKYKKAPSIFVIADDTILLLRSLVITNPHSKISGDITKYFIKELPLQKKINKLSVDILKNKRLNLEYKKLSTNTIISNIMIIDQTKWQIEFVKIKNKLIMIELVFSNYPISPPIIKMLSDIKINGLVRQDRTITIDQTNPANWKLTNNLTEICSYLFDCLTNSL